MVAVLRLAGAEGDAEGPDDPEASGFVEIAGGPERASRMRASLAARASAGPISGSSSSLAGSPGEPLPGTGVRGGGSAFSLLFGSVMSPAGA
eukprot:5837358-Pyramimonas_sp.AAC.1